MGWFIYNDPPVADCQTELSSCRTELAVITVLIKRIQGQGKKLFWAWECRTISHSHPRFLFTYKIGCRVRKGSWEEKKARTLHCANAGLGGHASTSKAYHHYCAGCTHSSVEVAAHK